MTIDLAAAMTEYGLPGIIIIGLCWFALQKDKKLSEVQEARIAEARESVRALEANAAATEALTEALRSKGAV